VQAGERWMCLTGLYAPVAVVFSEVVCLARVLIYMQRMDDWAATSTSLREFVGLHTDYVRVHSGNPRLQGRLKPL